MTTQQMNLIAVIGIVACWGAFALAWLAGAIFYEPGAPAERVRAGWLGTAASTGLVISLVAGQAVPRAALPAAGTPAGTRLAPDQRAHAGQQLAGHPTGMPATGTVRSDGLHAHRPPSESRYT